MLLSHTNKLIELPKKLIEMCKRSNEKGLVMSKKDNEIHKGIHGASKTTNDLIYSNCAGWKDTETGKC